MRIRFQLLKNRLEYFLAGLRASTQEERGDTRLNNARASIRMHEAYIAPADLRIIYEGINFATELKNGLESKRGRFRYLQAREYNKFAKALLRSAKTDSNRSQGSAAAMSMLGHDTMSASGHRPIESVTLYAVLLEPEVQNLIDPEARKEVKTIRKQVGDSMKPGIANLVEIMYNFEGSETHASTSSNASRAQELLRDMTFIYPEPRPGRDPYRHPIVQRAIDDTWFRDMNDIGVVNYGQFSPMPMSIIAITLTVIECCIEEWSDGTRKDSSWDDERFHTVYDLYVSSLLDYQAHSPESLYQLQSDLSRNAREHAGVPPDPVPERPGRL